TRSAKSAPAAERRVSVTEWAPVRLPSLGAGWDAAHEGHAAAAGSTEGLLPPLMQPSGNLVLPYPEGLEGYRKRFSTNWNPLKQPNSIRIGVLPEGQDLMPTPEEALKLAPSPLPGGIDPFIKPGAYRGR